MKHTKNIFIFIILSIILFSCDPEIGSGYCFSIMNIFERNNDERISITIEQKSRNHYTLDMLLIFNESSTYYTLMNVAMKRNLLIKELNFYLDGNLITEIKDENQVLRYYHANTSHDNVYVSWRINPFLLFVMQDEDYDNYPNEFNAKFDITYSFDDNKTLHTIEGEFRVKKRKRTSIGQALMSV